MRMGQLLKETKIYISRCKLYTSLCRSRAESNTLWGTKKNWNKDKKTDDIKELLLDLL